MFRLPQLKSAVATLRAKVRTGGEPKIGGLRLSDKTIYISKEITGQAGIVKLIDVNTKRVVGETNLDGNKLDAGRDYVIDSIRILSGNDQEDLKKQNFFGQGHNGFADAFKNAELRIIQDSKVLIDMPVSDLINEENGKIIFRPISTTPLIISNKEFEIELEYPSGESVPTAQRSFIRLEMRAHQARK